MESRKNVLGSDELTRTVNESINFHLVSMKHSTFNLFQGKRKNGRRLLHAESRCKESRFTESSIGGRDLGSRKTRDLGKIGKAEAGNHSNLWSHIPKQRTVAYYPLKLYSGTSEVFHSTCYTKSRLLCWSRRREKYKSCSFQARHFLF